MTNVGLAGAGAAHHLNVAIVTSMVSVQPVAQVSLGLVTLARAQL